MAVTARTLQLQRDLSAQLREITDRQTRDLVAAWVTAWDEVAPDLTAAVVEELLAGNKITRAQLLRSMRLRNALTVVTAQLQTLARDAGVRISGDLHDVIDTAGHAQASVIDSQLPPGQDLVSLGSWARVDSRQIEAIVRRSTQRITSRTRSIAPQAAQVVRRELIRGIAAGSGPRETALRIVARAEGGFNGGLNRALVISRTETLDAHRAGAAVGMAQHADIVRGWEWLAALDERTCASCWSMHGSIHTLDEPGPDDHPQGRCARNVLTRSWADLGFDAPEPPSVTPDAEQLFARMTPEQQRQVLGGRGYDAWSAGSFPMSDWSVRRENPGWRDSYVPAKPPSGGRGSRSAA